MNNNQNKPNYLRLALPVAVLLIGVILLSLLKDPSAEKQRKESVAVDKAQSEATVEGAEAGEQQAEGRLAELGDELPALIEQLRREQAELVGLRRRLAESDEMLAAIKAEEEARLAAFDAAFEQHPAIVALRDEDRQLDVENFQLSQRYGELNRLIDEERRSRFAAANDIMKDFIREREFATQVAVGGDPSIPLSVRTKNLSEARRERLHQITQEWVDQFKEIRAVQNEVKVTKTPAEEEYLAEWETMNERRGEIVERRDEIAREIKRLNVDFRQNDSELSLLYAAYLDAGQELRGAVNEHPRVLEKRDRIRDLVVKTRALRQQMAEKKDLNTTTKETAI